MSVDRPPEASPRPWPYLSWRHGLLLAAHLHSRPSLRRFLMDNAYEPLPYDEIMGRIGELAEAFAQEPLRILAPRSRSFST
jgi:hypothetical protein